MNTAETVLAVAGVVMALAQALGFFILTDMRERIMRLESGQMEAARKVAGGD